MTIVSKIVSSEVVAKTQITSPILVVNKSILAGIRRYILLESMDSNGIIRVYTKDNDIMQNAQELLGLAGYNAIIDWDDSTRNDYSISVGASSSVAETDVWKFDLGNVYDCVIHSVLEVGDYWSGGINFTIRLYYSEDDVNYTLFHEVTSNAGFVTNEKSGFVRARYLKITGLGSNSNTASALLRLRPHTIEVFANDDNLCTEYTKVDVNTLFAKHCIQTQNQKVSVVIFTNNGYYRIIDVESMNMDIIDIESI